ncbi:MAG: polysaccharide deacetylase family protein [Microcoleus vaginatus WJT46-NPBG5]|jgi:chitin deacetylase|nr:polysaccharide deacetylase family protein [Microcoleus vaginatus WJT46-NPBG5]
MAERGSFGWQQRTLITLVAVAGLFNIGTHLPWRQALSQNQRPATIQFTGQKQQTPAGLSAQTPKPSEAKPVSVEPDPPLIYTPPARFQGEVIYHSQLSSKEKVIALTFDDGPWIETPKVLGILKEYDVKATFFMIGQHVQTYPDIAKQVVAAGHAIGNHTWHHYTHQMDGATAAAEIDNTSKRIFQVTGVKTQLFRPPAGRLENGLAEYARNQKNAVVMWSVDPLDWLESTSPQSLVKAVLDNAQSGGIVLLHDGGGNRSRTLQALPPIIAELKLRGYRFVSVQELLEMEDREISMIDESEAKTDSLKQQL